MIDKKKLDKIKSKILNDIIFYYDELEIIHWRFDRDWYSNSLEDNKIIDEFLLEWEWEDEKLNEFNNICKEYDFHNILEYYQPNNNSVVV